MRVLIAIGCNAYEHQTPLNGAEADAQRMFDALIRPELGDYDPTRSKLLLSPSTTEVREALHEVLFSNGQIDTFTFFFAGHGSLRSGSFYMLVRDSASKGYSFSAFSLSDLFLAISEASPSQSNIVVDACEAGGLIADLGMLLKSNLLGNAGTPGITLVATSAQDQYSGESPAGGFGTNAILDCIEGRDLVQDIASALDLVEIGRRVSIRLQEATAQTPVVWGLNLYGPPRFCRNTRYSSDPSRPLRDILRAWPSASDASIRAHYDALWQAYASVSGDWNARDFSRVVDSIIAALAEQPEALAAFFDRLGTTVLERAKLSEDVFRPAQAGAALAVSLLPHVSQDAVARQARRLQAAVGAAIVAAGRELSDHLERERFALLASRGGGLSELFYLPLRVASVLGWTGAAPKMFDDADPRRAEAQAIFTKLLRQMLEHYCGSVITMSDAQASCWAIALSRAILLSLTDEAEQLIGLLYNSLIACKGRIARGDIPAEKVLDYLLARQRGDFTPVFDLIERPDETTTVLLRAAALLDLDEVFDLALWELDGHVFLAYLNEDFAQFGVEIMNGGNNVVWTVGGNIFRVGDLVANWPATAARPGDDVTAAGAVLASLLYPDRTPWFVLERIRSARAQ
jgi:Caspase domain